ncbi:mandelate racemase/muconate lactonizing enzyme family protein [Reyranella aquatilis]|uniref:Mandelate racemase/muconate lactonizing enzyme family protein n=1 Tax=Reyranella aquatilis TaxID=2035356 RepID=A0ABS8KXK0_9HYPH|nr:mandelate racemase/muconate lactonizing enzyme family protein [Reyranella aquatilis]MCC8430823.1 mandelate racemase/muconate lactonizing enzyme family protein [Reyranella aquatilis]
MKVKSYEIFRCDAGWRLFSFLKLVTDTGPVGWSEYNESFGSPGLSGVIENLMPSVVGMDPMDIELVNAVLATKSTQSRGGVVRQAIAAIENALLDIKGKALGVPVYQLFGGKLRDRIPVYWSHCGSYRMRNPDLCGTPAVRSYDDFMRTGEEVRKKGFTACKTNIAMEVDGKLRAYRPGFVVGKGFPERNWDAFIARSAAKTVEAFRAGVGPDVGIMLDTNFHFRTEGFKRIADAVGPTGLTWLELDIHDPRSIAMIREHAPCPIASGETLLERRDFRPYLEAYAFDTAIVDVIWNGFNESLKIASMADVYEVNVAPHNFYGHLASAISAHFCAAVPNFRIMEIDIDGVPWRDEIVDNPPVFENGDYLLPKGPGWGVEPNELAMRRHPPKSYVVTQ